jgi:hypothetical protein
MDPTASITRVRIAGILDFLRSSLVAGSVFPGLKYALDSTSASFIDAYVQASTMSCLASSFGSLKIGQAVSFASQEFFQIHLLQIRFEIPHLV